MGFKAYLFDLDGTLAASEGLKGRALAAACVACGGIADPNLYVDVMGEDWPTVTNHFFRNTKIAPDVHEFNEKFRAVYLQMLDQEAALTSGGFELISRAKEHGIKIGLVSSAAPWMVEKVLAKLRLDEAFDVVITQEDVSRHKPDPEAYLLALKRLRMRPNDVLVFVDSRAGLQAAMAAGCRCVAVRHDFNVNHDLSGAIATIGDFTEILHHVPEMPLDSDTTARPHLAAR